VFAFCLGLVVGATLAAVTLMVIGSLVRVPFPGWARVALVAAALVAVTLRDFGVVKFRLPENRRLVPDTVFRLGRFLGPFQFGLEMGTGIRTYVPSGLPYVVAIAIALLASPWAGVAAGLGFGLGRSLMTVSNVRYGGDGDWDFAWLDHAKVIGKILLAALTAVLATVGWLLLS
jgi:hypothetical protein